MTFDPTANRIPFGLLTPEERAALQAWPHGWESCIFIFGGWAWFCPSETVWEDGLIYRGKPAPAPEGTA